MIQSTDRILTTHVGSLPRSEAVTEGIFALEREEEIDVEAHCREVAHEVDAGRYLTLDNGIGLEHRLAGLVDIQEGGQSAECLAFEPFSRRRRFSVRSDNPDTVAVTAQNAIFPFIV